MLYRAAFDFDVLDGVLCQRSEFYITPTFVGLLTVALAALNEDPVS